MNTGVLNLAAKFVRALFRDLHVWEQVLDNTIEERKVIGQELRDVGVSHCFDKEHILR